MTTADLAAACARHGWTLETDGDGWTLLGNGAPASFGSTESLAVWLSKQGEGKRKVQINEIVTGDARELAKLIPDESIDMIFTDPVYENLDDYRWLAETAARVLKPGGACLVWCANVGQYKVQPVMAEYLTFVIPLVYTKVAKQYKAWGYKTFLWSTPCLWFQKGDHKSHGWLIDTVIDHCNAIISTDTPPSNAYKWHKNPEAYIRWLQAFTKPDDLVYDPFTGSGSCPIECKRLGRNFIASELQPDIAEMARKRLAQVQTIAPVFLEEQSALELDAA